MKENKKAQAASVDPIVIGQPLWCSRFRSTKREADQDASLLRRHGGVYVKVSGKRGGPWRVRAYIAVEQFAKFLSWEAKRDLSR